MNFLYPCLRCHVHYLFLVFLFDFLCTCTGSSGSFPTSRGDVWAPWHLKSDGLSAPLCAMDTSFNELFNERVLVTLGSTWTELSCGNSRPLFICLVLLSHLTSFTLQAVGKLSLQLVVAKLSLIIEVPACLSILISILWFGCSSHNCATPSLPSIGIDTLNSGEAFVSNINIGALSSWWSIVEAAGHPPWTCVSSVVGTLENAFLVIRADLDLRFFLVKSWIWESFCRASPISVSCSCEFGSLTACWFSEDLTKAFCLSEVRLWRLIEIRRVEILCTLVSNICSDWNSALLTCSCRSLVLGTSAAFGSSSCSCFCSESSMWCGGNCCFLSVQMSSSVAKTGVNPLAFPPWARWPAFLKMKVV